MTISLSKDDKPEVLGLRNNGEPILPRSSDMISYDLENYETKKFVDSWYRWTPYMYLVVDDEAPYAIRPFLESLVLLDI